MKHGDFTKLAKDYVNRPGYSKIVLSVIGNYVGMGRDNFRVADIGAGTGKLTENLFELGLSGCAVEPNEAMRAEGVKLFCDNSTFTWYAGAAEDTGLPDNSFDWVLMGSSFHWTDCPRALKEFHRILKKGGFFTAIWNPRDIEGHPLHEKIEAMIYDELPNMNRVSSGSKKNIGDIEERLLSTKYFSDLFFVEASHEEHMSKERYMGIWRSVNDIQVQAGERKFKEILKNIEEIIKPYDEIVVPYKSRAWTVKANKKICSTGGKCKYPVFIITSFYYVNWMYGYCA